MTGSECKLLRAKLGIKQIKLAWDCGIDPALISRWEAGVYRLRPYQAEVIRGYLQQHLLIARAQFAELEIPPVEVDRALEKVSQ